MLRLVRLDAPDVLHHVIGRGIEKRKIFLNEIDRNGFIERLTLLLRKPQAQADGSQRGNFLDCDMLLTFSKSYERSARMSPYSAEAK